jgi:hypothetical protein
MMMRRRTDMKNTRITEYENTKVSQNEEREGEGERDG